MIGRKRLQAKKTYIYGSTVTLLLIAASLFYCLGMAGLCSLDTFFITADQQGQGLYRQGDFESAARRFADPNWRATAFFRAGDFKQAASIYSGMGSAEGAFNHGNALVMQGKYEEAVKRYDRALARKPGWEAAEVNRGIAVARAETVKTEGGDMTGGMMGADDFVFDSSSGDSRQDDQTETVQSAGDAEMQAMWLRRVQTEPADFLRAKFAYQYAMETSK